MDRIKQGNKYNSLTAIKFQHSNDNKHSFWLFRCDCGKKKVIRLDKVKSGKIKSCGCLKEKKDYTNRTCEIKGCNNLGCKLSSGQRGRLCVRHRREKQDIYGSRRGSMRSRKVQELTLKPCSVCGWDKTVNDVHRVIAGKDGGKYELNNCVTLCPNCHRLYHLGVRTKTKIDIIE